MTARIKACMAAYETMFIRRTNRIHSNKETSSASYGTVHSIEKLVSLRTLSGEKKTRRRHICFVQWYGLCDFVVPLFDP